jgi:diacylglycerol O-acyltransferase / wax synthase
MRRCRGPAASGNWASSSACCRARLIDLSRPPWECTLIEGLKDHRFAIFIKIHHSLIDGVSGMMLLQHAMSPDPKESLALPPFWSRGHGRAPGSSAPGTPRPWPT